MRYVPDSFASGRPPRRLREYNKCHNPAGHSSGGGRFCSGEPGGSGGASKGGAKPSGGGAGGSTGGASTNSGDASKGAYKRPTSIKVNSVEEAVEAILKGKVVELPDVRKVNTVLKKLADMAQEAKRLGQSAPTYDLCQVTVPGTNLFCGSKLRTKQFPNGVPRIRMPQLSGEPMPGTAADRLPREGGKNEVNGAEAFIKHLQIKGIKTERGEVAAASLKASQAELVGPKVAGMMTAKDYDPSNAPIFISRDNYVIDGHHRWAATVGRDAEDGRLGDRMMRVVRVDAPITEIIFLANSWSKRFGIKPKAAGKSAK